MRKIFTLCSRQCFIMRLQALSDKCFTPNLAYVNEGAGRDAGMSWCSATHKRAPQRLSASRGGGATHDKEGLYLRRSSFESLICAWTFSRRWSTSLSPILPSVQCGLCDLWMCSLAGSQRRLDSCVCFQNCRVSRIQWTDDSEVGKGLGYSRKLSRYSSSILFTPKCWRRPNHPTTPVPVTLTQCRAWRWAPPRWTQCRCHRTICRRLTWATRHRVSAVWQPWGLPAWVRPVCLAPLRWEPPWRGRWWARRWTRQWERWTQRWGWTVWGRLWAWACRSTVWVWPAGPCPQSRPGWVAVWTAWRASTEPERRRIAARTRTPNRLTPTSAWSPWLSRTLPAKCVPLVRSTSSLWTCFHSTDRINSVGKTPSAIVSPSMIASSKCLVPLTGQERVSR